MVYSYTLGFTFVGFTFTVIFILALSFKAVSVIINTVPHDIKTKINTIIVLKGGNRDTSRRILDKYGREDESKNGFIKKTQKTPKAELEKAKKYRKDYLERCEKNEEI